MPTAELPEPGATSDRGWQRDLWEDLGTLPDKQRAAVVYHHVAGLPHAEVAAILGGTPAAARRASADGIAALRRLNQEAPQ
jgi:DNA-directed RNA polymerase specialized sigma24 family protein